jgi:chorismate-pyruvate lyase
MEVVVEKLDGFGPVQRVLLTTAGTLQGALSAFFRAPVVIELVHQEESGDTLQREVNLVRTAEPTIVCRTASTARVTDPEIRRLMLEGTLGLGQIVATLGVETHFALEEVGQDAEQFWRSYRLWGDGFSFRIRETFPAPLYATGPTGD